MTEFSFGGCHINCKSCVGKYDRRGITKGPMYNYAGGDAKYEYGNAGRCYDCHDGYYNDFEGFVTHTFSDSADIVTVGCSDVTTGSVHYGTCKCTFFLILPNLFSLWCLCL